METNEVLDEGQELTGLLEVMRGEEEVERLFCRVALSIVDGVAELAVRGVHSPAERVTAGAPEATDNMLWEFAAVDTASCEFSMLSMPGGTMTTLSSESLARDISTSSASSFS